MNRISENGRNGANFFNFVLWITVQVSVFSGVQLIGHRSFLKDKYPTRRLSTAGADVWKNLYGCAPKAAMGAPIRTHRHAHCESGRSLKSIPTEKQSQAADYHPVTALFPRFAL